MRLQSAAGAVRVKGKASGSSPDASTFLEVAREGIEPPTRGFSVQSYSGFLRAFLEGRRPSETVRGPSVWRHRSLSLAP